jgi:hypothetical protein
VAIAQPGIGRTVARAEHDAAAGRAVPATTYRRITV